MKLQNGFRNRAGRYAAGLLAGAALISMVGTTAMAAGTIQKKGVAGDGNTSVKNITLTKKVLTDGNTYAPATSFTFNVTKGQQGEYDGNPVLAGIEGGLSAITTVSFTPGEIPEGETMPEVYTGTATLQVNEAVFKDKAPGIYHYQVKEGTPETPYEGIDYDDTIYDVYVYVYVKDGNPYVGNVVSTKTTMVEEDGEKVAKTEKTDLIFENDYGQKNNATHDITFTKEVTGNQGDKNKLFTFNVKVQGESGEWYKVLIKTDGNSEAREEHLESGAASVGYEIKDTGSIQIFGLTKGDTYTVEEADYGKDGYTTTYQGGEKTGTVDEDHTAVKVINDRTTAAPTGIVLTVAPYALLMGLAGVLGFFFRRRGSHTR